MRIGTFVGLLVGFVVSMPVGLADNGDAFRDDHPERYTVERGDTLWDISERFLDEPWLWPEIWHVNPDIENPHLIYPGDEIRLVYIDGEPRLTVERGERTVKLSPEVREEELEPAISTIPMEAIRPFLDRTRAVEESTLEDAPYVVGGADERVLSSRGDRVYLRNLDEDAPETLALVRRGDPYVDPETGDVLGFEARYLGAAEIQQRGDPATAMVTRSNREIRTGDRLLEQESGSIRTEFQPSAPEPDVEGVIIDVLDGVSQIGQYDVVVLNRGTSHALAEGDVLAIYEAGREIQDDIAEETVTLPGERAGELIVFRTYERLSFALVMNATRAIQIQDQVRKP
ncbi:MAG: LysM peptidoglycan-binding domain-containing protein [Ectothiorhodospiraceae bacterium]